MQPNVTALPAQASFDKPDLDEPAARPASTPALAAVASLGAARRKRRETADADCDADFEEICNLIGGRFARSGALDPELCRFVGLLPNLRNVKDRALVREAKFVAGYLGRADVPTENAKQIINGLDKRLRPFGGVPALHVMFGILLFFAALLVIDVVLSYFWQTSDWSSVQAAETPSHFPGFFLFNVSPWLVIAIGSAGGLGSIVSMLTRIQSFNAFAGIDRRLLWMIGAMRPVIGIAFALFIFAVLQAQILPFSFPQAAAANFEFVALAFIAGFSERLSRGVISTVEGRFLGEKPE